MVEGRFAEEQEIIDEALAMRESVPWPVKKYISHFIRNDMMSLLGQCKDSREAREIIQHMSKILGVLGM